MFPKVLAAMSVVVAMAGMVPTQADVTYLASSFETLYRVTPERSIETWNMGTIMRAMHRSSTAGTIYVMADVGGDADESLYTLNNALSGTPSLSYRATLNNHYGSMTGFDDQFYAFSYGDLYSIDVSDPYNPVETFIGPTGLGGGSAGAAYDPVGDVLYVLSRITDSLYSVDPLTAETTLVGAFGIDTDDLGGEWFDGQLYAAAQNLTSGSFEIGTIDHTSGAYAPLYSVASGASDVATGLTVIPEPATLGLLLVAGLTFARRH
jgi:hypothetical protein